MANPFYLLGKRLLLSKSRATIRGSIIFLLTHLLLIIGIIFTAEILLLILGLKSIYVPLTVKILNFISRIPLFWG